MVQTMTVALRVRARGLDAPTRTPTVCGVSGRDKGLPNKLSRRFSEKSGESDDLQSQGGGTTTPPAAN